MHNLIGIQRANDEQVRKEFRDAIENRDFPLARRIQLAHLDLNLASNIPWWEVGDHAR